MTDPRILAATAKFDAARAAADEAEMNHAIHELDPFIDVGDPEGIADAAVMRSNLPYKHRQDLSELDRLLELIFDNRTQLRVADQPYKARFWYVVSALCLKLNEFDRAIYAGELATGATQECSDIYMQARIKVALSHEMAAFGKPGSEAESELATAKTVYSDMLERCKRTSGLYLGNLGEILHGLAHVINEQSVWSSRWKRREVGRPGKPASDSASAPTATNGGLTGRPLLEDGLAKFVETDSMGLFRNQGPPTGLSGVRLARILMEQAVAVEGEAEQATEPGVKFVVCQGTLLAEASDYAQARDHYARILDPSNQSRTQPEDRDEAHFYLADALTWLGDREEAREHFETFRDGCVKRNDYDGIAHYRILTIADRIRTADVQRIADADISGWLNQLDEYTPSRFAMPSIREYHGRLKSILMFIREVRRRLSSASDAFRWTESDVVRWANSCCMRSPALAVLTDMTEPVQVSPKTIPTRAIHPPLTSDETRTLPGVYLGQWSNTPPIGHSNFVGMLSQSHRCVTANRQMVQAIGGSGDSAGFLFAENSEQATVLATIGTILWTIRTELVEPYYPFVLAPVERAPVFSAQGGDVGYVHSGTSSKP